MYVCPQCRGPLTTSEGALHCNRCDVGYPREDRIADFARGAYYDSFTHADALTADHLAGLEVEVEGTRRRIVDYYLPLLEQRGARRVLDCGCGNGLSVDLLAERGYDTWGIDLSALRKWQWRERREKERLSVASALALPFADESFDAVISSGVIEHIGVDESRDGGYRVSPLPTRDALRETFLRELRRVTRRGGTIWLDFPNGAFPIDFWHGDRPGAARWHAPDEGFLPTFAEIKQFHGNAAIRALSPYRRLAFQQASRHWYGKLFSPPMNGFFRAMTRRPFHWLAGTAANPFLVIEMTNDASR